MTTPEDAMNNSAKLADEEKKNILERQQVIIKVSSEIEDILVENKISVKEWNQILDRFGMRLDRLYNMTFKELREKYDN